MYDKVFISYATEDHQYAEKLYVFLLENDFQPWMDKKNILPGQNWDLMINQGLRNADFVILLLSSISVNKRSYVQREFKQAFSYCQEKLESDIYIIPVKIDICETPQSLQQFQCVEYSSGSAFESILNALNSQRDAIRKEDEIRRHKIIGFEYEDKLIKGEYGDKSPKQVYEISYPVFTNESNESLMELNIIMKYSAIMNKLSARHNYFNYLQNMLPDNFFPDMDSLEDSKIQFHVLNKNFISFTDFLYTYSTGTAHGNYGTSGHNYLINPLRELFLRDLFESFDSSISILRDAVSAELLLWAKNHYEGDVSDHFYTFEEGLESKKENFENFYFKENSVVFIYNPYHLAAWSYGDQQPELTFDKLLNLFPFEAKLHEVIRLVQSG